MGRPPLDLKGKRIGILIVLERIEDSHSGKPMWLCRCDCGNEKIIQSSALTNGVKSCGCYRREWSRNLHTKHGGHRKEKTERLYGVWNEMKQRCNNPNSDGYKWYGARGIKVCSDWADDYGVFREWAYANGYSDDLTIDRIDSNGDYTPSNCRWVDCKTQARNTRSNHIVEYGGEAMCVAEWAEKYNLPYRKLLYELNKAKKDGHPESGVLKAFILRGFIYG